MTFTARFCCVLLAFFLLSATTEDGRTLGQSGLPLPRFVSVKADKANIRRGPGRQYPVLWQLQRRGLPLEIIREYQLWRQVRDHQGGIGWIHSNLLRGSRGVVITQRLALHTRPTSTARIKAYLDKGVIAELHKCLPQWCKVSLERETLYIGWIARDTLWGVYPFEWQP